MTAKFKIGDGVVCNALLLNTIVIGYREAYNYTTYIVLKDNGWDLRRTDAAYYNVPNQYIGRKVWYIEEAYLTLAVKERVKPIEDGCYCSGPCGQFYPMAVPNRGDKLVCYSCKTWGH